MFAACKRSPHNSRRWPATANVWEHQQPSLPHTLEVSLFRVIFYILFRVHLSLTVYCLCMPKLLLYFSLKQFIRTICMHWPIDLYYYYNVYVHKIAANILWFGQSFRGKLMHRLTEEKHAESIKIFSSNWIMWRMFIELIVLLLLNTLSNVIIEDYTDH